MRSRTPPISSEFRGGGLTPQTLLSVRHCSKLKKDLRGRKFHDNEAVNTAVMEHFADKETGVLFEGQRVTSSQMWKVYWNKGRLYWKIAKLFYFCNLKMLVRPETFGPYHVCLQNQDDLFATWRQMKLQRALFVHKNVLEGLKAAGILYMWLKANNCYFWTSYFTVRYLVYNKSSNSGSGVQQDVKLIFQTRCM